MRVHGKYIIKRRTGLDQREYKKYEPELREDFHHLCGYCGKSEAQQFIVVTEAGILAEMRSKFPNKEFIPAPPIDSTCGCNECKYMKMVSLESIIACLENESPEITMDEQTRKAAERSIINMINIR